ncbi:FUSC family protein [Actinomadura flavalba]|uniref:FUSC family protein n=1 Tax=Actinomadura flavalba TaxID=1120938 RepID=UPI000365A4BC|nr:FUSC family protein [Actinomadura flavalba]
MPDGQDIAGRAGRRVARGVRAAWRRVRAQAWPIVQSTAAATLAWYVAGGFITGHEPFFAPISAVVALNATGGERGANALRLLRGVLIGIIVGEFATTLFNGGNGTLAFAVAVAATVAVAIGAQRIVIAQAAAGAILTVTTGGHSVGAGRLVDALIGAGVALVFSQILFPVRLVALLRRAEAAALGEMTTMLRQTARELERDGEVAAQRTVRLLGDLSAPLAELGDVRRVSHHAVRRTINRWGDRAPLMAEDEKIDRLIMLGESCLSLVRTATAMSPEERHHLGPVVREMAEALDDLAPSRPDPARNRAASARALKAAHPFGERDAGGTDSLTVAAYVSVQMVATDIMLYAGIDPDDDP